MKESDYLRVLRDDTAEAARQYLKVALVYRAPWLRGLGSQRDYNGPAALSMDAEIVNGLPLAHLRGMGAVH